MRKFFKLLLVTGIVLFIVVQFVEQFFVIQYKAIPQLMTKTIKRRFFKEQVEIADLESTKGVSMARGATRTLCDCSVLKKSTLLTRHSSSSCSFEAMEVGPGQKVISYSLFVKSLQDQEFFIDGISENIQKIEELFPDWIVYIFTNISINSFSCELICQHPKFFMCDIRRIPQLGDLSMVNGRVWRFLPISDPNVDILISRDLDSLPSEREKIAVDEWMQSNKTFHVMRDSHWHDSEILAGMWGAKTHLLSTEVKEHLQSSFIKEGMGDLRKKKDQELLETYIFTPYKSEILAHDSYYCDKFGESITIPFPTRRKGEEFVGLDKFKEVDRIFVGRLKSCPERCRPIYGKHWTYC